MNEDKASRYQRLKRQADIASFVWTAGLLVTLIATGLSLRLRAVAESLAPGSFLTITVYVALLSLLSEIGTLPLAFYSGLLLERRYGLSTETLKAWVFDQLKAFGIGLVLAWPAALAVYFLIARFPDRWWLAAGALFSLVIVGLTNLAPVLLLPLFYTRQAARSRIAAGAAALRSPTAPAPACSARTNGAWARRRRRRTRRSQASAATRRILVSDTMLAEYSDEEIEVVLAHELGASRPRRYLEGDRVRERADRRRILLRGASAARGRRRFGLARAWPISPACRCCCSPPELCRW